MENNTIPQLRFPEFKQKWVDKKLGEIGTFYYGKSAPKHSLSNTATTPCVRYGELYTRYSGLINKIYSFTEIPKKKLKFSKGGEILIPRVGEDPMDFSKCSLLTLKEVAIGEMISVFNTSQYQPYVVLYIRGRLTKQFARVVEGGNVSNLYFRYLENIYLFLPTLAEQIRIATFLTTIDKRINLLRKKKAQLEQYKKGIIQKLFSQTIRFKDDKGNNFLEWEEKKLKFFIDDFIVPMRDKPKELDGEIPWCRIEDFKGKYLTASKSNQGVSLATVSSMNLKVYPVDTLLVSCSAYLGRCAIVKKELITNQTFIGLVSDKDKVDVEFLYYVMRLHENQLNRLSSGTTISYLSRNEFENFNIYIPIEIKEQKKIASFLSSIDSSIDKLQLTIDNSQLFKKGLLQKMFV